MHLVYLIFFKCIYTSSDSDGSNHIYSNLYETVPYDQKIPSVYLFSDRLNNSVEDTFLLEFISFNMAANLVFCGSKSEMVSRKKNQIFEYLKRKRLPVSHKKINTDIFTKYEEDRSELNNKLLSIEYLVVLRLKFKIEKILKRKFFDEMSEFKKYVFSLNRGIINTIKDRFKSKMTYLNKELQNIPQTFLRNNFKNCEMAKYFKNFDTLFCDMNLYTAIPYLDVLSNGVYLSSNLENDQIICLFNLNLRIYQSLLNDFSNEKIIRKSIKVIVKMIYDTEIETYGINDILLSDYNLKFYQIYKKTFKNLELAYMNILIENILNKRVLSDNLKRIIRELKGKTIKK